MSKKIEVFETWTYRRMLRIPWTASTPMLRRMSKRTEILDEIKRRKLEYFGHVMRNSKYKLLQLIIQGKVEGRRGPSKNFMLEELTSVWAEHKISILKGS
ncbi:endonuclease-reverse transcriptase [Lasius niger]|uniref:Endonuclease-reverse transcriptase n=1 Tax=Lasius niger TaxID=67767 RepID=A0A0J7NI89_LASNI|nr:endonuclease-reverse transcriptase [Lasius niger]